MSNIISTGDEASASKSSDTAGPDTDGQSNGRILTDLAMQESKARLKAELSKLRNLLEVADDSKSVYESLIRYSLHLHSGAEGGNPNSERKAEREEGAAEMPAKEAVAREMRSWLGHLRELDPLRTGRWDDLEAEMDAARSVWGG